MMASELRAGAPRTSGKKRKVLSGTARWSLASEDYCSRHAGGRDCWSKPRSDLETRTNRIVDAVGDIEAPLRGALLLRGARRAVTQSHKARWSAGP